MVSTKAICMTSSVLGRKHQAALTPAWPRVMDAEPVRHPSRQRRPYRPRGHISAESLVTWGIQDPSSPRTRTLIPRPAPYRHKRLLASGVAAAVVGALAVSFNVVVLDANDGAPARTTTLPEASIPIARATTPQLAAEAGLLADVPILPTATTTPGRASRQLADVPPAPFVQASTPRLLGLIDLAISPIVDITALSTVPVSATPRMPAPGAAENAFTCPACASPQLRLDGFIVSLRGGGQVQDKIAADFAAMGASAVFAEPRGIDVATSQIRFYRPQDMALAQSLARIFDATVVDVTWLSDAAPARIDLLLAADTTN